MSRIMRSFYEYKNDVFSIDKLKDILYAYQEKLKHLILKLHLSFPILLLKNH